MLEAYLILSYSPCFLALTMTLYAVSSSLETNATNVVSCANLTESESDIQYLVYKEYNRGDKMHP